MSACLSHLWVSDTQPYAIGNVWCVGERFFVFAAGCRKGGNPPTRRSLRREKERDEMMRAVILIDIVY